MNSLLKRSAALMALVALCLCTGAALAHDEFVSNPDHKATVQPPMENTRLTYLGEDFEGAFPPAGWTVLTSGVTYTWDQTTAASNTGANSAWVQYGPQGAFQDEWLITPALDLGAAAACYLEFYEAESYWANYGLRHHIMVSTTGTAPADFTPVVTWTPGTHTIPADFGAPTEVDLSAYIGNSNVYFAFRYEGDWADDWFIDTVRFYEPSAHDVAAVEALPYGHVDEGSTITPQGVVKNLGLNTESFDVLYEIFDGATLLYSETGSVAGLAPGMEATVDFAPYTPAAGLYFTTVLTTLLAGDEDTGNDVLTAGFDTYPIGHTPLVFLFTNSGCDPCVGPNQAWDAAMPGLANTVALMRIHAWWPYSGDIMYLANTMQNDAYINEYGVSGVPDIWLDGLTGFGTDGSGSIAAAEAARFDASPMSVTPVLWNMATEQLTVEVDITAPLPDSDYRLVSCITEDGIEHEGPNEEPVHNQAFRYAYPDQQGTPIATTVGLHTYTIDMPLDGGWVFSNLRGTVYVQDRGSVAFRDIVEAGTNFLGNILDVTPVAVSNFDLAATPGSVEIGWTSSDSNAEFRLTRVVNGASSEIAINAGVEGRYTATDAVTESGQREYLLHGRLAGEEWMLVRSENVQASAPVLASRIAGNYPNPFNPKTMIRFSVAETGVVKLSAFDLQGRLVAELFEGVKEAGDHQISWDAGDLGSGIYFVQMIGENFKSSRKVVLTK